VNSVHGGAKEVAERRLNAVILSAAKDPGSSRGVGEQSKVGGFFAQNAGSNDSAYEFFGNL